MALDPHIKQQIRYQVELNLEELCHWQLEALDMASEYLLGVLIREYQIFNRVNAKRLQRKAKRQRYLKLYQKVTDRTVDKLMDFAPQPFSRQRSFVKTVSHIPLKGVEFLEKRVEDSLFEKVGFLLNKNRDFIEEFVKKAPAKLEHHQNNWRQTIKEELASRFPLTDEERLVSARDITHEVNRFYEMSQLPDH